MISSTLPSKIDKNISDNDYGEILNIYKNAENWYYHDKCTIDSYTLHYSRRIVIDAFKGG